MADNTKKYRVAVYLRLARCDDEALELQKEKMLQYAKENGHGKYNNILVYADNGASGNNFDRPGFTKMMADINSGDIDTVIVKSIDRISRDFIATGLWIDEMKDKGVTVKTADGFEDGFLLGYEDMRRFFTEEYRRQRKSARAKSARKPLKTRHKGDRGCV